MKPQDDAPATTRRLFRAWHWCRRNPLGGALIAILFLQAVVGPIFATAHVSLRREADESERMATEFREKYLAEKMRADKLRESLSHALETHEQTLERYVETVKNNRILNEPRFQELRKELLKNAQIRFQQFAEKTPPESGNPISK